MVDWSVEIGAGFGTGRATILLVIACSVLEIHLICGSTVVPILKSHRREQQSRSPLTKSPTFTHLYWSHISLSVVKIDLSTRSWIKTSGRDEKFPCRHQKNLQGINMGNGGSLRNLAKCFAVRDFSLSNDFSNRTLNDF